jgi:hypothetical protein
LGIAFFIVGAIFAIIFILNNILRTVLRRNNLRLWDILLVFMVVVLMVSGLLVDNIADARFDLQEQLTLLTIIPMFILSIPVTILEATRPQRLKRSRGILGLGVSILLFVATFSFNILSLFIEQNAITVARIPTPVNETAPFSDPCSQETIASSATSQFFGIISQETDLTAEELADVFAQDGTVSVANLVERNGGDPRTTVNLLNEYVSQLLLDLVTDGCIPSLARPLALSQITPIIEDAVFNNFDTLINQFAAFGNQTDNTQQTSLIATPNETELQSTRRALIAQIPTTVPTNTPTNTPTITVTPSPTITRTPLPSATATATRERFVTATPTATATLPNPCLGTADFNVNLRDFPSQETGEVLLNIPFGESFAVYAPNEDGTWWYVEYDNTAGWLNGEFISLTRACQNLPPRRP